MRGKRFAINILRQMMLMRASEASSRACLGIEERLPQEKPDGNGTFLSTHYACAEKSCAGLQGRAPAPTLQLPNRHIQFCVSVAVTTAQTQFPGAFYHITSRERGTVFIRGRISSAGDWTQYVDTTRSELAKVSKKKEPRHLAMQKTDEGGVCLGKTIEERGKDVVFRGPWFKSHL